MKSINNLLQAVINYLKTNVPKVNKTLAAFLIICLLIVLSLAQCQHSHTLKKELNDQQVLLKQEQQRTTNNLKALQDSVTYYKQAGVYSKSLLAAKQNEIDNLDASLAKATGQIKKIITKQEVLKDVYITDISSKVITTDIATKVDHDSAGNTSIGINSETPIFSIHTQSWFHLTADSNTKKVQMQLVNKYGTSPSQLQYELNFRLTIAQSINKQDGSMRLYIKPTDLKGNPIDPKYLGISDVKGVDYIDVERPQPPPAQKKKPAVVVSIGPQLGATFMNGNIKPYIGFGVGVGLNLFR